MEKDKQAEDKSKFREIPTCDDGDQTGHPRKRDKVLFKRGKDLQKSSHEKMESWK